MNQAQAQKHAESKPLEFTGNWFIDAGIQWIAVTDEGTQLLEKHKFEL